MYLIHLNYSFDIFSCGFSDLHLLYQGSSFSDHSCKLFGTPRPARGFLNTKSTAKFALCGAFRLYPKGLNNYPIADRIKLFANFDRPRSPAVSVRIYYAAVSGPAIPAKNYMIFFHAYFSLYHLPHLTSLSG